MEFKKWRLIVLIFSGLLYVVCHASRPLTTTRSRLLTVAYSETSQVVNSTLQIYTPHSQLDSSVTSILGNLTTFSLQSTTSSNRINRLRNQTTQDLFHVESGQLIRFKSGGSHYEGKIEIFLSNQWSSVCGDHWTQDNAHVICRQLGYKLGSDGPVTKISEDSVMSESVPGSTTPRVTCHGNETRIQDCTFNESNVCQTSQAVSVRCALNTGCDPGWLAGDGLCYKLFTRGVSFEAADESCRAVGAHLVRIESHQENDFISNFLISPSFTLNQVWIAGRRSVTGPRDEWKWYRTSHLTRFSKWFPGWPPNSTLTRQPMQTENRDCISLSRDFFDSSWNMRNAKYYFWKNWPCANSLPYVCKKTAELAENECYEGDGSSYRGFAYTTVRGSVCQKWSLSSKLNQTSHPHAGLGDHNFCRNPDADRMPWCWVDTELNYFGYCTVPPCNAVCDWEKEMQCGSVLGGRRATCIPLSLVCNNRTDCPDGADERMCNTSQIQLSLAGGIRDASGRMTEGRVEVVINNITGTICDDGWSDREATVICRMLGFGEGMAVREEDYGQGHGAIWFDDVHCFGTERNILDCSHARIGSNDCTHTEDARVRCLPQSSVIGVHSPVECGRRPIAQPRARIIGGQYAVYGAFPWQARIMKRSPETGEFLHSCGGTIIDRLWILSAAHCFEISIRSNFRVRVGDHHNSNVDAYEEEFEVDEIVSHPGYTSSTFTNGGTMYDSDMALVRIRSTPSRPHIQFNNHVQPACLPTSLTSLNGSLSSEYRTGTLCEISGWGVTRLSLFFSDLLPVILKSGVVPIMNTYACQRSYVNALSENMFCAGYQHGRVDTCQGDSGGPLVCNIDGSYTVLGLTSWGHGCGHRYAPGVYTKVGQLVDWIRQILNGRRRHV